MDKSDSNQATAKSVSERIRLASHLVDQAVEVNPEVRSGVPVFRGTRIPVSQALSELADGATVSEIAEDLELDEQLLRRFLQGAAGILDVPENGV